MEGFAAETLAIDASGKAALLRDASGRIMLLKQHGGHFAGRMLNANSRANHSGEMLTVDSGERRFGAVDLQVEASSDWAKAINALKAGGNA